MKCMVTDKYGNKKRLGWKECSLDIFQAIEPFRMDKINIVLIN